MAGREMGQGADGEWQSGTPPVGSRVEFETPGGQRGRGRLMAMENGRFALETPHEDFTGRDTFFAVARWRHAE